MKIKFFTLLLSFVFAFTLSAQEANEDKFENLMPKKGNFGATLIVNGLIDQIDLNSKNNPIGQNILFARYYYEDDKVFRLGFGLDLNSRQTQRADSIGNTLQENDTSVTRYTLNFAIGYEKHLKPSKRLDPYLFGQLDISFIGKTVTEIEQRNIAAIGTSKIERTIKEDGGTAFSLSGGAGLNYFFAPKFSIGTELALQLAYQNIGGTITDNEIVTQANGTSTGTNFTSRENKVSVFDIDVNPVAQINISYFF